MNNLIPPYVFLKFGEKKHLVDLQKNGCVFFNTFQYFTEIEDKKVRGDVDETVTQQYLGELKSLKNIKFPNGVLNVNIPCTLQLRDNLGNIFCMYSIDTRNFNKTFKYSFDKKLEEFHKHLNVTEKYSLIILNVPEFLKRIEQSLKRRNFKFSMGFVKYCNMKKHIGNKTPFLKDHQYNYQNEYRIVIYQQQNLDPIPIHIGNVEDISMLVKKDVLDIDLEFHYSE